MKLFYTRKQYGVLVDKIENLEHEYKILYDKFHNEDSAVLFLFPYKSTIIMSKSAIVQTAIKYAYFLNLFGQCFSV